jgi:membrane protein implicated in regulation of membrane protease activity
MSSSPTHTNTIEVTEELVEVTGGGLRIAEIAVVTLFGLLLCPPLLILAAIVAVPALAITAVVGAIAVAVFVPVWLVRKVRAHHRKHGTTMFIHHFVGR